MAMKFITSLFALVLLISGCAAPKRMVVASIKELPSWYTHPEQSTSVMLYATGEGEKRDDAITSALSAMASTLSVSVSSQFNTKSVVKEGTIESYQTLSTSEIQSDVKKIRISNYEVMQAEEFGFKKYIVLIQSDKKKLLESFKKELEQRFAIAQNKYANSQSYNAIKQLSIYKEATQSLSDVPNMLTVMHVLDTSFDGASYIKKLKDIDERYEKLLNSLSFSIVSDNESQNLKAPIQKGLSEKKFILKESGERHHFTIFISSKIEQASSYGFSLARSAIEITIKDYNGAIIGSNKLNITGQSTQGYAIAKESIAIKFNEMVKKEGIQKVLGLEL
jgi:hypothetical protein